MRARSLIVSGILIALLCLSTACSITINTDSQADRPSGQEAPPQDGPSQGGQGQPKPTKPPKQPPAQVTQAPPQATQPGQGLPTRPRIPTKTQSGPQLPTRIGFATATSGVQIKPIQGSISGNLSYPSDYIPPLRVVAFDTGLNAVTSVDTTTNQMTYQLSISPGTYYVVAYTMDGVLAGGYSQAVLCGLTVACTDHSLVAVTVSLGGNVTDIDPGDWYAPPNTFPPMP